MMTVDTTPFAQARQDIRDLLTIPLQRWMQTPPAIRRDAKFVPLLAVPLDLAAADFQVTVTQGDRGWYVEATKDLTPKARLHLVGHARSYISALYQLADSAGEAIDRLQREERQRYETMQGSEVAA